MKIKSTPGTEYIYNSIATYPKDTYINKLEFVSDVISAGFYNELVIGFQVWKYLIDDHNEKI